MSAQAFDIAVLVTTFCIMPILVGLLGSYAAYKIVDYLGLIEE